MPEISISDSRPRLSVAIARIEVSTTEVEPRANLTSQQIRSSVTAESPFATVTASVPASAISYIELTVGAYLDESGRYRLIGDIVATVDASAFAVGKSLTDGFALLDAASVGSSKELSDSVQTIDSSTLIDGIEYGFQKRSQDEIALSEQFGIQHSKPHVETVGVNDDSTLTTDKAQNDSASLSETFSKTSQFSRTFAEIAEQADLDVWSLTLIDPVGDMRYVDAGYYVPGYAANDSVFSGDSMTGVVQSFVSGDYFLEDYVGLKFGPY